MWSIPSLAAAAAPSTATGSLAVAEFRYVPDATRQPTVDSKPRLAACTLIAFVFTLGISGLR